MTKKQKKYNEAAYKSDLYAAALRQRFPVPIKFSDGSIHYNINEPILNEYWAKMKQTLSHE